MKRLMMVTAMLLAVSLMSACADKTQELIVQGTPGTIGQDGISMGVDVTSEAPSCLAGGSTVKTFIDANRNSALDIDEVVKQTSIICNGIAGTNGTNGSNGTNGINGTSVTVAAASAAQCPSGGVVLNNVTKICNGVNGTTGPQGAQGTTGAQGPQGIQGIAGAQGAAGQAGAVGSTGPQGPAGINGGVGNMTPVQLCPGDTASFKEYGFVVGNDLYAVYFDKNQPIAFLAKLNPGNYVTTNGSNCTFTYSNNGTVASLSNNTGTTNVPLAAASSGLACQVYDSRSIDRSSGNNVILTNATPKFDVIVNQLDVGDSQASNGFPKFTAAQQALIGTEDYALDCSGYVNVPKTQTYNLTMLSDDGSNTYVDNQLVIAMDQLQSPTAKSSSLFLTKGLHKLNVTYFQGPLSQIALKLTWSAPEFSTQVIPNSALSH